MRISKFDRKRPLYGATPLGMSELVGEIVAALMVVGVTVDLFTPWLAWLGQVLLDSANAGEAPWWNRFLLISLLAQYVGYSLFQIFLRVAIRPPTETESATAGGGSSIYLFDLTWKKVLGTVIIGLGYSATASLRLYSVMVPLSSVVLFLTFLATALNYSRAVKAKKAS